MKRGSMIGWGLLPWLTGLNVAVYAAFDTPWNLGVGIACGLIYLGTTRA